ncbi:MAG: sensor histidine kinase [Candidatus Abyssobacteria bacterium SURF_17]|uniref:histidine kinase n=1 Tax=Candidatus Abyssobacteria bacterium SURF_17 TaxID=2093361 RepID=A0A419EU74_9BACT|nr:MAG: sensor histidine kinase [Candidatus Abyssubacteria bacterium SURF_17]
MGNRPVRLLYAKKRVGIGVRLAIMMAALLVLSTGLFAFLSLMSQKREAIMMFVSSSLNMCRSFERILRISMLENRRDEIQSAIQQIAMEDVIHSASLVTHLGKPVYSSERDAYETVPLDDARCSGCHASGETNPLKRLPEVADFLLLEDAKLARVWLPIYNAPECYSSACHAHSAKESVLGIMQLDVSYADIDKALSGSHARLMTYSILMALATSLIVLGLIRRWVTKPVKDLLDGTRRVAEGELGHVIPVGEAELGALSRAFNKMQERLLSSQRQLIMIEKLASIGKLSASVAHEINNPLTGILTFAEDLVDTAPADDPHLRDYKVIHREAIRCRQIVRQLLDFSRQDKPNLRPVDINDILTHTIGFVSKQAIFRNISVETNLGDSMPPVIADPAQLEQVVLDILVNAAEAMPKGGRVFVTSCANSSTREVEVAINDTGPGITKDNLQRVFEPFFSTKGGKSMGIGLAVSWNIVNQHGGRLEADSKPGEGATFRIVLPWGKTPSRSAETPVQTGG